ncbi:hypothetical protein FB567DRAFT_561693 [Paraphoma chrysanthemicola]|uniref:Uncharacterized protein n=1 Tax=Paraphoma chrysanthemicola TaxID=798071 RepID=A0A8K0R4D7_9PLEO|nr:hypothetical protein FB567DRAFT_561693 [Paraphoma chrysanthemicola]
MSTTTRYSVTRGLPHPGVERTVSRGSFIDRAPYPAEWAFSRIVDPPKPACRRQVERDQALEFEINHANQDFCSIMAGYHEIPHIYNHLFQHTKRFVATIQDLVAATMKCAPLRWANVARYIVDYSINILRSERLGFEKFLHGQRESIYWILDNALLRICLDQWEFPASNFAWDRATEPIRLAFATASEKLPQWAERDAQAMLKLHFYQVENFQLMTKRYFEKTTRIGQLPGELANVIVEDVCNFEKIEMGDLRRLYLPKGKSKA